MRQAVSFFIVVFVVAVFFILDALGVRVRFNLNPFKPKQIQFYEETGNLFDSTYFDSDRFYNRGYRNHHSPNSYVLAHHRMSLIDSMMTYSANRDTLYTPIDSSTAPMRAPIPYDSLHISMIPFQFGNKRVFSIDSTLSYVLISTDDVLIVYGERDDDRPIEKYAFTESIRAAFQVRK